MQGAQGSAEHNKMSSSVYVDCVSRISHLCQYNSMATSLLYALGVGQNT